MNSMNVQMKFHGQQSQPGEAQFPLKRKFSCITLVNVYVDLVVFTRIAGTS